MTSHNKCICIDAYNSFNGKASAANSCHDDDRKNGYNMPSTMGESRLSCCGHEVNP